MLTLKLSLRPHCYPTRRQLSQCSIGHLANARPLKVKMAEALAALGLAANVLQFVECGFRIIKTANDLKSSVDGATKSNREVELLARNLNETMKAVKARNLVPASSEMSQAVSACNDLSDELVQMLESLKIDPEKDSSWTRMKASVRNLRKADEIKALDERLNRFRTQICDRISLDLL